MSAPPYLALLGATVAIELPLALLLAPRGARRSVAAAALWLNLATHPLASLWLVYGAGPFAGVELAVALAEYAGYRRLAGLSRARALAVAGLANGVTAAVGLALSS